MQSRTKDPGKLPISEADLVGMFPKDASWPFKYENGMLYQFNQSKLVWGPCVGTLDAHGCRRASWMVDGVRKYMRVDTIKMKMGVK